MRKRIIMGIGISVLCMGVLLAGRPMQTKAASGVPKNSKVSSYGILWIQNGSYEGEGIQDVKIYASDLHYLQNELDALMAELP